MKANFQKTIIFPMDFNDFMKHWGVIGVTWGHFGGALKLLGGLWEALGSHWEPIGAFSGVCWGLKVVWSMCIGAYEGHCGSLQRYG